MTITYTWNKKKLVADFFGMVSQIKFERKGVDGSYTDVANAILVIPEDDEEHADEEVARRIQRLKDEAAGQKDDVTLANEQNERSKELEKKKESIGV